MGKWRVYIWMEFVNCMALGCEYICKKERENRLEGSTFAHCQGAGNERPYKMVVKAAFKHNVHTARNRAAAALYVNNR